MLRSVKLVSTLALGSLAGCASLGGDKYAENLAAGMKTPETSSLFVKYVDPESKVVSYILKPGLVGENQQSLYFTAKSMTNDGRFLVFDISCNEYESFDVKKAPEKLAYRGKKKAVIDFMKDKVVVLEGIGGQIPYLDVDNDVIYYGRFSKNNPDVNGLYKRELLGDSEQEILVCKMPRELTEGASYVRYFTHLTLSGDRTLAYLDSRVDDNHIQGVLNIKTGEYTKWGESGLININHGQIHPVRNDIALNAWECVPWKDSKGQYHSIVRPTKENPNVIYPRLQLTEPGKRTMIPAKAHNAATHERWDEQGDGFYWCGRGVWYHDLKTGEQTKVSPIGTHAMMSIDKNYVIADNSLDGWWRGCAWQIYFHNRKTEKGCYPFTRRPAMCTKSAESNLHPDPHPQFVCGDRYVVCTINNADGHMDLAVTPVPQLIEMTSTAE